MMKRFFRVGCSLNSPFVVWSLSSHCPVFVHSLSSLCPVFVQSLSSLCPVFVQSLSTLCPVSLQSGVGKCSCFFWWVWLGARRKAILTRREHNAWVQQYFLPWDNPHGGG